MQAGGNCGSFVVAFIVVAICTAAVMVVGWQTNITFMSHLLAFVLAAVSVTSKQIFSPNSGRSVNKPVTTLVATQQATRS